MPGKPGGEAPQFPDPDLIDALSSKWEAWSWALRRLATKVSASVGSFEWSGDAERSAMQASQLVAQEIQHAADNANLFAEGLTQYASQVRQAIQAAKASLITEVLGLVFGLVTLGFGNL